MSLHVAVAVARPWPLIWGLVLAALVVAVLGVLALRGSGRR